MSIFPPISRELRKTHYSGKTINCMEIYLQTLKKLLCSTIKYNFETIVSSKINIFYGLYNNFIENSFSNNMY